MCDTSARPGVKFTSPSLRPLAEQYKACDDEYELKQSTLVAKVIGA